MKKPKRTFIFFVRGNAWLSKAIMRVTKSPWSHCGIGFQDQWEGGQREYFEALFGKGFQGPKPLLELIQWVTKNPGCAFNVVELPLSSEQTEWKYTAAQRMIGKMGYNEWQLLQLLFFEKIGKYIGWHVPRSDRKVVCSEAVARILSPDIDFRNNITDGFDEISPLVLWDYCKEHFGASELNNNKVR